MAIKSGGPSKTGFIPAARRGANTRTGSSPANTSTSADAWATNMEQIRGDLQSRKVLKSKNTYPASNPLNNEKNHAALLDHVKQRLLYSKPQHDLLINRFMHIDREIEGFLQLDDDDKKRERDNKLGKGLKPTDVKLSLVQQQLDDAVTYLMSVFAPDSGIFTAIAKPDVQIVANAFAQKLNEDGDVVEYYSNFAEGFVDMLKYNLGGWVVEWVEKMGPKITNAPGGQAQVANAPVFAGSTIESVDPYNLYFDPSCHPTELADKGEYFALIDVVRKFRIERMAENEEIFDIDRFVNKGEITPFFWRRKPDTRTDSTGSSATTPDWVKYMTADIASDDVTKAFEIVNYYGWVCPAAFGLSSSTQSEVWRITVINHQWIVRTEKIETPHGKLPIALGMPIKDKLGMQKKSHAEQLIPLQNFSSFLLNAHQRATRKALYGVTLYNPNVIPFQDKAHDDMESAKIPIKPTGMGTDFDLRRHFANMVDAPATENTLGDIGKINDLMQKFLPTDFQKQVADLDRATQYQAAATVQGGNRRNLKMAKLLEDQAMKKVRFMLMYNFIARGTEPIEVTDPTSGQMTQIQPAQFRDTKIEFAMAEGLKGIDKMTIIQNYKDLLGMVVQSQQALQQFDFIKFISYIGDLMGDKTDINQYRITNPLMSLPPQQQQQLAQLAGSGQLDKILAAVQGQQAQGAAGAAQVQPAGGQAGAGGTP